MLQGHGSTGCYLFFCSFSHLPALVVWASRRKGYVFVSCDLQYPEQLSLQVSPQYMQGFQSSYRAQINSLPVRSS